MILLDSLPHVKGKYRLNADLSKTNWFAVGGNAEILFKPQDQEDLSSFLRNKPLGLNVEIIGVGSNVIIRDCGIKGVVVKLGREFAKIHHNKVSKNGNDIAEITVGAACLNSNFVSYCKANSIANLEFLVGIPGSIGGAIVMNSGCYGSEIADSIVKIEAINEEGELCQFSNDEMDFSYRLNGAVESSKYGKLFFTEVLLHAPFGSETCIKKKIDQITQDRIETQPIKSKTGGSSFKNPKGLKAWKLIDESGCRGLSHGGAKMSEKHCNFMINDNNATAQDLEELGEIVRKKVKEKFDILLEWEIKIIGEKND